MNIDSLRDFTNGLRSEVGQLRHRGLSQQADVLESVANDHEQILNNWHTEALTLTQAAEESGYSYSALQQMKDINIGTTGTPRIRRCDIPYKPRRSGLRLSTGQPDLADEIIASRLAGE